MLASENCIPTGKQGSYRSLEDPASDATQSNFCHILWINIGHKFIWIKKKENLAPSSKGMGGKEFAVIQFAFFLLGSDDHYIKKTRKV